MKILPNLILGVAASLPIVHGLHESNSQKPEERKVAPPHPDRPIDRPIEGWLKTRGAIGLIHGNIPETETFVFTYGNPIRGEHFSLIPANKDIKEKLQKTVINQEVTIKGKLVQKSNPQRHIYVTEIEIGKKQEPEINFKYSNAPRIPNLEKYLKEKSKQEINCTVHASLHDGKVLIVNYGGHTIPVKVFPGERKWTKDLWSGDKIQLKYEIFPHSRGPAHLHLPLRDNAPLKVTESITSLRGKKKEIQGHLVWFPKSHATDYDIWGIEEKDSAGTSRVYVLLNSKDNKDYEKIDKLLRNAWKVQKEGFVRRGTSFYNPNVYLRIQGVVTQRAQNQGNAVIELFSKDVEIIPPSR